MDSLMCNCTSKLATSLRPGMTRFVFSARIKDTPPHFRGTNRARIL
jgi:hypothetical protein